MIKRMAYAAMWIGILCAWPMVSGCHSHKHRVVEQSETIQESEPQMVSPGKEKLE